MKSQKIFGSIYCQQEDRTLKKGFMLQEWIKTGGHARVFLPICQREKLAGQILKFITSLTVNMTQDAKGRTLQIAIVVFFWKLQILSLFNIKNWRMDHLKNSLKKT